MSLQIFYFSPKNSHYRGAGKLISKKKRSSPFSGVVSRQSALGSPQNGVARGGPPPLRVQARSQKRCTRRANDKLGGAVMDVTKLREYDT